MSSVPLIHLNSVVRSKRMSRRHFFYSFVLHENARELATHTYRYTRLLKERGERFRRRTGPLPGTKAEQPLETGAVA
jgi:hypothetical protein